MTETASTSPSRLEQVTRKLTALALAARPDSRCPFDWPVRATTDRLAMSEALLPMAGLEIYFQLNDEARARLAMLEAVNFFSLAIAGERDLMSGLAQRLHDGRPAFVSEYLQHVLDEENAHTAVLARFCLQYGGGIFPHRQPELSRDFPPEKQEFLFFARSLVFKEVAHYYHKSIANDPDVWALAREINRTHAEDGAHHIAFGRLQVEEMWERFAVRWSREERRQIGRNLADHTDSVLRSYVNPDVYRDAGLPPYVERQILESPHWAWLAVRSTEPITRWLARIGVPCGP